MSDKANLSNAEPELTQRIQMHFPRGVLSAEVLKQWNGCPAEIITAAVAKVFGASLEAHKVDLRFAPLTTFQFTVPKDYNHPTQLASFAKENRKKFYFYNDNITDRNFAKVTNKLVPGKTYEAKIFKITKRVTSEDYLAFRKKTQKAIFVGAQGISVVWQQAKEQFPKGKWTVSFDEKDAFWQDANGRRGVPRVGRNIGDGWFFDLGRFEGDLDDGDCLLCLFDLSA